MIKEIENRASQFITILSDGIQPEQFSLSKGCKGCEFNLGKEQDANGYRECWKELADVDPTIFDLYFGGAIGHYTSGYYLDELISDKKVSFWDIDPERF